MAAFAARSTCAPPPPAAAERHPANGVRRIPNGPAGLLTFKEPRLPADLNAGFPDKYISKDDGEASPVDTIVEAANGAGVDWQVCARPLGESRRPRRGAAPFQRAAAARRRRPPRQTRQFGGYNYIQLNSTILDLNQPTNQPITPFQSIHVVTYRNNLNKLLLTPLGGRDGWTIDACMMVRRPHGSDSAAPACRRGCSRSGRPGCSPLPDVDQCATGEGAKQLRQSAPDTALPSPARPLVAQQGGTLFLDIVKAGQDTNTWPGQDRMCYYGYKFEALCTGGLPIAARAA